MNRNLVFVIALIVLCGLGWLFFGSSSKETDEVSVQVEAPVIKPVVIDSPPANVDESATVKVDTNSTLTDSSEIAEVIVEESKPLVAAPESLHGSDEQVVLAMTDLDPSLVSVLAKSELVRKLVLTVNLFAEGDVPAKNRPLEVNLPGFAVLKISEITEDQGAHYGVDPASWRRATPLIEAMTAIPPERVAQYYVAWKGVFELAHAELGRPERFSSQVEKALENIVAAAPVPDGAVLVQPNVFYKYQDAELEAALPLDKWLWRLGPANMALIQAYAAELEEEFDK